MKKNLLLTLFSILFLPVCIFAGIEIHEVTESTDMVNHEKIIDNHTFLAEKNKVKLIDSDQEIIFDMKKNQVILVFPEKKIYWEGSPKKYAETLEKIIRDRIDEMAKSILPEKRELYTQQMNAIAFGVPDSSVPSVDIRKIPKQHEISGYPAKKYQILVDSHLKEDIWISSEIDLTEYIDLDEFNSMSDALSSIEQGISYQTNSQYRELLKTGYRMKMIEYDLTLGNPTTTVTKIYQKKLSKAFFSVPKSFKKVTLKFFLMQQLQ